MGILGAIEKIKTEHYKKKANHLQKLRKVRIREEGRANIRSLTEKEKGRIAKARSSSFFGKLQAKAKKQAKKKKRGVLANLNERSKNKEVNPWLR